MINFHELDPQKKIYLAAAGWLFAFILSIVLIIYPLISQIRHDGSELAQKKQDIETFYSDWQILEKAQKDYKTMEENLSALPAFLAPADTLKFIVLLEKFAQATNNNHAISLIDQTQKDKNGNTSTKSGPVSLQINLRGKFPDLMKFLIYLENAPYYNKIQSLRSQILPKEDKDKAAGEEISTVLELSVYR